MAGKLNTLLAERTGNKECVHHWVIDELNVGRCKKCPAVKDFGALMSKDKDVAEIVHPAHSKRGKRKKQAIKF